MKAIVINSADNVAVALEDLKKGSLVETSKGSVTLLEDITRGHKFALRDIAQDEGVIKYGYPIGKAKELIKKGSHVHVENVKTALSGQKGYSYTHTTSPLPSPLDLEFMGYERADGRVGIRNELWIIPTVFCVNHVAQELCAYAKEVLENYPHVDGCLALTHPYGCSQMGEDQETTQRLLAALTRHQNAGGQNGHDDQGDDQEFFHVELRRFLLDFAPQLRQEFELIRPVGGLDLLNVPHLFFAHVPTLLSIDWIALLHRIITRKSTVAMAEA